MRHAQILSATHRHEHYASLKDLSRPKISPMPKRSEQLNVRMSPEDLALLQKAASALWPGLQLTNSTMILALAKRSAEEVLHKKMKKGQ
jgi:hypothetical protein